MTEATERIVRIDPGTAWTAISFLLAPPTTAVAERRRDATVEALRAALSDAGDHASDRPIGPEGDGQ